MFTDLSNLAFVLYGFMNSYTIGVFTCRFKGTNGAVVDASIGSRSKSQLSVYIPAIQISNLAELSLFPFS